MRSSTRLLALSLACAATLASLDARADPEPVGAASAVSAAPATSTASPTAPSPPPAPPTDDTRVRDALARHDAELAQLRAELAARPLDVRISGFVQTDWVVTRQSSQDEVGPTGAPLNENRFTLRRGHLRADVDRGIVLGALEIDANTVNGPQLRPIDAEASIRWPPRNPHACTIAGIPCGPTDGAWGMATIGLFKTPFGFEVLEADNRRPFLERSTVIRALFPGEFDLGARIAGGWRFLDYKLGLMNGDPIGERAFPGRDPNESKDVVGRLGIDAQPLPRVRVLAGFSWVTGMGFHKGTPSTKDTLVWRDANQNGIVDATEIQVIPGSASTPSSSFKRHALGGDLRVLVDVPWLGELALRGEIVWATNLDRAIQPSDPVALGRDQRQRGFYVGFTQELGRHAMVGARFDRYDPDADAASQVAGTLVPKDAAYTTLALMAAARVSTARFIVEYDKNKNPLGRGTNGLPTTLADDALTLRGEVSF